MRTMLPLLICIVLVAMSAAPAASVPVPGIYNSIDIGGGLLLGHSSTSRACVHTCYGVGDVFNVQSWDGTTLATQWYAKCGQELTPFTVTDNRVAGTGTVVYNSTFTGGTIWFAPGAWGTGTGTLTTTYIVTTVEYVNIGGVSTPVSSRANIQSAGTFTEGNCTLTFLIANGYGVGETDATPPYNVKPATYPNFMDTSCGTTRVYGSWGDISEITLMIECATPTKLHTWGAVRKLYR